MNLEKSTFEIQATFIIIKTYIFNSVLMYLCLCNTTGSLVGENGSPAKG